MDLPEETKDDAVLSSSPTPMKSTEVNSESTPETAKDSHKALLGDNSDFLDVLRILGFLFFFFCIISFSIEGGGSFVFEGVGMLILSILTTCVVFLFIFPYPIMDSPTQTFSGRKKREEEQSKLGRFFEALIFRLVLLVPIAILIWVIRQLWPSFAETAADYWANFKDFWLGILRLNG